MNRVVNGTRFAVRSYLTHLQLQFCMSSNCGHQRPSDMAGKDAESIVKLEARTGFTDSKNYDSNRPTYQDEAVKEVVRMLMKDWSPNAGCKFDVLELGAGTGIFTRKLLDALPSDAKVLVSEPMENFLSTIRTTCPEVETNQFAAKEIPLENHSVQAIVAAQCFHWFAEKESMSEICRVLKPGGNFVFLWNIMDDRDEKGFSWAFYDLTSQWRKGAVQYVEKKWEKQLDDYDGLSVVEKKLLTFNKEYTEEGFLQFVSTLSFIHRSEGAERAMIFEKIRNLLRTHPETKDQTIIKIPFYTDIRLCKTNVSR